MRGPMRFVLPIVFLISTIGAGAAPAVVIDTPKASGDGVPRAWPDSRRTVIVELASGGGQDVIAMSDVSRPKPPSDDEAGILAQLQGDWVSSEDTSARMRIDGTTRTLTYDGAEMEAEQIEVATECGGNDGAGPYLSSREETSGDVTCYAIETLGPSELVLMHLPRGNLLIYERAE